METGFLFEKVSGDQPMQPKTVNKILVEAAPQEAPVPIPVLSRGTSTAPIMANQASTPAKQSWVDSLCFWRRKKKATALVQTEWPLDKVTVLRNDLLDTDVEVVQTQPQLKMNLKAVRTDKPVKPQVVVGGEAWSRLNARESELVKNRS
jgi:hypothetical protein